MRDGFKWTIIGGIVGLIIVILGTAVIIKLGSHMTEIKTDWLVAVSMPVFIGVVVWYTKLSDKVKAEQLHSIFEKIETKASTERVVLLEFKLIDHKESDNQKTLDVYKTMSSLEKKMDMILEKLLKV